MVTDKQVRRLMEEMARHGNVTRAAQNADMDRKTARAWLECGELPSERSKAARDWRTRPDPFVEHWEELAGMLKLTPELEAKTLFEHLTTRYPGRFEPGQLRTLQRRVQQWRAQNGPPKVVFFAQEHRPGEAAQTDFTHATELGVTIAGEPFPHLLCHVVLPYSNWEWATVCRSESMAALKRGVQGAVFRLGRVPTWHQTDNSTAATHELGSGERGFNAEYAALMKHLGMKPRTIKVGEKHQNGDVESQNGVLKRRLEQHLLLRQNRDFACVRDYEIWVQSVLGQANRQRTTRFEEELAVMQSLAVEPVPEYTEVRVGVTSWSTIRVLHNAYSVPARLIGADVRVRIWDDRLEVIYAQKVELVIPRLLGRMGHRVDYRHVIWSLVQKPGAFERYRYREDLFPSPTFRRAYDALVVASPGRVADVHYLRILHLAASTREKPVEAAVADLLAAGVVPTADRVKAAVVPERPVIPDLVQACPDLHEYDALLGQEASA